MIPEQKAKAIVASGIAFFVMGLVILLLFVVPAIRHGHVASAQEGEAGEGVPPEEGMPPGEFAGGDEFGGGGGEAPSVAAPVGIVSDPLEAYRPNPFAARLEAGGAVAAARMAGAMKYGPDWSKLPIAEHVAFVKPEVPAAPTPPAPVIRPRAEELLRITSIMWGAEGQALAAYETADGSTGVVKPGDRVQGWMVTQISRTGVTIRNLQSGETQELDLRSRPETKEPERPHRRPQSRERRPGGRPARGGRAPAPQEPPG